MGLQPLTGPAQPMKGAGSLAARFARRGPARGVDPTEQHQDTGPPATGQSCFCRFQQARPLAFVPYAILCVLDTHHGVSTERKGVFVRRAVQTLQG